MMIKKYKKYSLYIVPYLLIFISLYVILYFGSIEYINNFKWNTNLIIFLFLFFLFFVLFLISYISCSIYKKINFKNYLSNEIQYKKFKKIIKLKKWIIGLFSVYLINSILLLFEFFIISFFSMLYSKNLVFLASEKVVLSILSSCQISYIVFNIIFDIVSTKRNKEIAPLKYVYLWNSKNYIVMSTIYSTINLFISILLLYSLSVDFGESFAIGIWSFFPIWYGFVLRDIYKKYKLLSNLIYLNRVNNNVDIFIKTLILSNKTKEVINTNNNFLDKLLELDLIKQFKDTFFYNKIKIYLNLTKDYSEDSDEFLLITGMLFLYIYQLYSDNNDDYFFARNKYYSEHFIKNNFLVYCSDNKKPLNSNIYEWFNKKYKEDDSITHTIKTSFYQSKQYNKYNSYLIKILYWVIVSASKNPFKINDIPSFIYEDKLIKKNISKYFYIKNTKIRSQVIINYQYLNYLESQEIIKNIYSNITIIAKKTIFINIIKEFIEYKFNI